MSGGGLKNKQPWNNRNSVDSVIREADFVDNVVSCPDRGDCQLERRVLSRSWSISFACVEEGPIAVCLFFGIERKRW